MSETDFSFADLVNRLGHPPKSRTSQQIVSPEKIFQAWINHLPRPLVPGTCKAVFRLLFPHEGSRRRYGLKETRLAAELETLLGLQGLKRWDAVAWDEPGAGCLGKYVEQLMKKRVSANVASAAGPCTEKLIAGQQRLQGRYNYCSGRSVPRRPRVAFTLRPAFPAL